MYEKRFYRYVGGEALPGVGDAMDFLPAFISAVVVFSLVLNLSRRTGPRPVSRL